MVSGDGTVAVTQVFRQPRGLLVDSFDSKEDLINALHTSCFIPGYRFAVSKPKSAILFFALMFSLLWFGKDICRYLNSIWSTLEKTWENEEISAVMETTVQCLVLNVSMFCVQVLGTKASDYFPRSCLHWWRPDTFHAPYSCWQNSMYSQTFSPRVPIQCMCIRSQFWRMECIGFDHELLLLISTAQFLRLWIWDRKLFISIDLSNSSKLHTTCRKWCIWSSHLSIWFIFGQPWKRAWMWVSMGQMLIYILRT